MIHRPRSDVDSEKFFYYLLDTIEKTKDSKTIDEKRLVCNALKEALKKTEVNTALDFVLVSPKYLYGFRNYEKNPDYYNLLYLTRSWKGKKGLELDKKTGEWAAIISSQPLSGDEEWRSIETSHVIAVPKEINTIQLMSKPKNLRRPTKEPDGIG